MCENHIPNTVSKLQIMNSFIIISDLILKHSMSGGLLMKCMTYLPHICLTKYLYFPTESI